MSDEPKRMMRFNEQFLIDPAVSRRWLDTYASANSVMEDAGYPSLRGTPVGHLLDVPEISKEASKFAGRVRERESKKQRRSVDVGYTIHLTGNIVVVEASFSRPSS
jgi:hypothetical protein